MKKNVMEKLEDRILFDAVPDAICFEQGEVDTPIVVQSHTMEEATQDCPQELIIVDQGVEDSHLLVNSILSQNPDQSYEVVYLSPASNGVTQITEILSGRSEKLSAVHIISHGSDGQINLGNSTLDSSNLIAASTEVGSWGDSLTEDADMLFYGCELASTEQGMEFISKLSAYTGADVAASTDITGSSELGGDWELEAMTGAIDVVILNGEGWSGTLESPPAFSGEAGLFQVYSNQGQLGEMNITERSMNDAANSVGAKLNAVGYRTADNYAYGILSGSFEVARLGSDGTAESLGTVDGLPTDQGGYFVGDFGGDDLLYVRAGRAPGVFYGINVDTMTVDNKVELSTKVGNIYDIAYNATDNHFYSSQRGPENLLLKISAEDGQVTKIGYNGISKLTFGAMFADANGDVFGGANQTGEVFQFDTTTGVAKLVGVAAQSGTNDGFSNAAAILELPPLAADDAYQISASDQIKSSVFFDNGSGADTDGNGDEIKVIGIQGSSDSVGNEIRLDSGALVTLNADGSFEYDTNGAHSDLVVGQTATESFTYTITDGTSKTSATVTINIDGEFDPSKGEYSSGVMIHEQSDLVDLKGLNEEANTAVVAAGDFNGDGFQDAIVGDTSVGSGAGAAYVVYGDESGLPEGLNVKSLLAKNGGDGSQGFVIQGANSDDRLGSSVAMAGDVNGDGIDDIIVGATDVDDGNVKNVGAGYVIFGNKDHGAQLNVEELYSANGGDGTQGFVLRGVSANDNTGAAVGAVGDINGDGIDDIAISATDAEVGKNVNAGKTYVFYGNKSFEAENKLNALNSSEGGDGSDGFVISAVGAHDHLGAQISGGVDVNGDGIDDMVVTARDANSFNMVDTGQSYIIHGNEKGFDADFNLGDLFIENGGDGTAGTVIHGTDRSTGNGSYVTLVADTNGDGLGEIDLGLCDPSTQSMLVKNGTEGGLGPEFQIINMKKNAVYVDNFDHGQNQDGRSWDSYMNNVTLHSTEGSRITIWGDPHVITEIDGVETKFDIGYGAGSVTLSTGTQIKWATYAHDLNDWPKGPPIEDFTISFADSNNNLSYDTADGIQVVDELSAMTDAELREFIMEMEKYAGSASDPLAYNG